MPTGGMDIRDRRARESAKQMARAAVDGRRLTITFVGHSAMIIGYAVGMDDFHWVVVDTSTGSGMPVVLVPKGGAIVSISPHPTLDAEPEDIQARVRAVGAGFFMHCRTTYLGQQPPKESRAS